MEIERIKGELLEICKKNGGYITDIEILFYFGNGKEASVLSEENFLSMFKEIKTKIKGRKDTTRTLSDQARRNLKKLILKGYTIEDLENSIKGMYHAQNGVKSWAEASGNDTPTHLLREGNFERYLNLINNLSDERTTRTTEEIAADIFRGRNN